MIDCVTTKILACTFWKNPIKLCQNTLICVRGKNWLVFSFLSAMAHQPRLVSLNYLMLCFEAQLPTFRMKSKWGFSFAYFSYFYNNYPLNKENITMETQIDIDWFHKPVKVKRVTTATYGISLKLTHRFTKWLLVNMWDM